MTITIKNLLSVIERVIFSLGDERRGYKRRSRRFKQIESALVVWHANADGFARRMRDTPGHLSRGFEDEGPGARSGQFQKAILPVIDLGKMTDLGQITTQKSEMVTFVQPTQTTQGIGSTFIVEPGDDRIAGIGRNCDEAAIGKQLSCLFQQAGLGILRVNDKKLSHENVSYHSGWLTTYSGCGQHSTRHFG